MDSFFFHVKGGQGFNRRHVGQKKPQGMDISLRQKGALKTEPPASRSHGIVHSCEFYHLMGKVTELCDFRGIVVR
jgi:hypothetical protein